MLVGFVVLLQSFGVLTRKVQGGGQGISANFVPECLAQLLLNFVSLEWSHYSNNLNSLKPSQPLEAAQSGKHLRWLSQAGYWCGMQAGCDLVVEVRGSGLREKGLEVYGLRCRGQSKHLKD